MKPELSRQYIRAEQLDREHPQLGTIHESNIFIVNYLVPLVEKITGGQQLADGDFIRQRTDIFIAGVEQHMEFEVIQAKPLNERGLNFTLTITELIDLEDKEKDANWPGITKLINSCHADQMRSSEDNEEEVDEEPYFTVLSSPHEFDIRSLMRTIFRFRFGQRPRRDAQEGYEIDRVDEYIIHQTSGNERDELLGNDLNEVQTLNAMEDQYRAVLSADDVEKIKDILSCFRTGRPNIT